MKTIVLFISTVIVLLSCSKTNPTLSVSHWTYKGTSYIGTTTGFFDSSLNSNDSSKLNEIIIQFSKLPTAGIYTVTAPSETLTNNECYIVIVFAWLTPGGWNENSFGGGTVTVTINGGKTTASFSNISMYDPRQAIITSTITSNGSVSGVLIQQ